MADTVLATLTMEGYLRLGTATWVGAMRLDRARSIRHNGVYQHGKKGDWVVLMPGDGSLIIMSNEAFTSVYARDVLSDDDVAGLTFSDDVNNDEIVDAGDPTYDALAYTRLTMN